jgi:hypothetical protein
MEMEMCSTFGQMLLLCGPAPTVQYALMAVGLVVVVGLFVRP